MALRGFTEVPYLPFLSLRPAEMRALQELPDKTKDGLLPLVHLRPWTTSYQLQNSLDRLNEAYGNRPTVLAVGPEEPAAKARPVHGELAALRSSGDGYLNWCEFIKATGHEHFIPAVQIDDAAEIGQQVDCFYELGRGLVIIVPKEAYPGLPALAATIANRTDQGVDTCFVLDEGISSREPLQRAVFLVEHINTIKSRCPAACISVSGSSFPDTFTSITQQEIFERTMFELLVAQVGRDKMIYSDRGSARIERQRGGGGAPAPRIDYPQAGQWRFFRSELEGFSGYQEQAQALLTIQPPIFDAVLRVWGTQMIERTAHGDTAAIKTPARSTAVRINLHLQKQTFFNDPISLYDTEDEWDG